MIRLRRRNTIWLAALAMLTALSIAVGAAPLVWLTLLAIWGFSALASTVEIGRERETILDAIRLAPVRGRITPQAKEAAERARSQGGYSSSNLIMMDLGLIAIQSSYEGIAMRRTRNISKDDDGIRPFITLNIEADEAERNALIRFEIRDQFGQEQYVHEMRTYLREGEMSIMPDDHLPLAGNSGIQGTGDWDLRVYIDGNLIGMHSLMLTPSINERQRRLSRMSEGEYFDVIEEAEQEIPPRLQDLLQANSRSSSSRSSSTPRSSESSSQSQRRSTTRRRR